MADGYQFELVAPLDDSPRAPLYYRLDDDTGAQHGTPYQYAEADCDLHKAAELVASYLELDGDVESIQ